MHSKMNNLNINTLSFNTTSIWGVLYHSNILIKELIQRACRTEYGHITKISNFIFLVLLSILQEEIQTILKEIKYPRKT
jgi:hypothetical protein